MCNVYDLPPELILSIFTKGMEDELNDDEPCSRRLKTFASIMRNVCRPWRGLIDDPVQTSFWISRSTVEVGTKRIDGTKSLAEDLAIFKANLLTSEGCDLAVLFRSGITPNSGQLRLMVYALDMLAPNQSQVVKVSLIGGQPDVMACLLEQITSRWKMAHRLLEVDFFGVIASKDSNYGWRTISQSLIHPDFTRLDIPQCRRSTWLSLPATMAHLESLHKLEIPSTSWLVDGLLLPHTLRHLTISHTEVESIPILYQYLSNNTLRNHLRSITVGRSGAEEESETTTNARRPAWKAKKPLILPHLLKLEIAEATKGQITSFLECLFCPSLDALDLQWLDTSEPPADLAAATTGLHPSLESMSGIPPTYGNNGVKSQFASIGSQFHPVRLRLMNISCNGILFNLDSMDTQHLESLFVRVTNGMGGRQVMPAIDHRVSVPYLTTLDCFATQQQYMHFLAHISVPSLFSVKMTLLTESGSVGDYFRPEENAVVPFPSVRIMKHRLEAPLDIPSNLLKFKVFPNLQELHIFHADYNTNGTGLERLAILKDTIISLCRALGPTFLGSVPFSNLQLLDIECRHDILADEDPDGRKLAIKESEICTLIDDFLRDRMRLGASPLHITEPVNILSSNLMDWHTPKHKEIMVRISATSTPTTMDHEDVCTLSHIIQ